MPIPKRLGAENTHGRVSNPTVEALRGRVEAVSQLLPITDPLRMELEARLASPDFQLTRLDDKDKRRSNRLIRYSYLELTDGRGILFEYDEEAAFKTYYNRKTTKNNLLEAPPTLRITLTRRIPGDLLIEEQSAGSYAIEIIRDPDLKDLKTYRTTVNIVDATGEKTPLPISSEDAEAKLTDIVKGLDTLNNERLADLRLQAHTLKTQLSSKLDLTDSSIRRIEQFYQFLRTNQGIMTTDGFRVLFQTEIISRGNILTMQEIRVLEQLALGMNNAIIAKNMQITPDRIRQLRMALEAKLAHLLTSLTSYE